MTSLESALHWAPDSSEPVTSGTEFCLHALVEVQAARDPQSVAMVDQRRAFAYEQLNAEANRLAHYLRRHGVTPGARVATLLEHGADMIVAAIAILKCGAAWVSLESNTPERHATILAQSRAQVVMTGGERAFERNEAEWVRFDDPRLLEQPSHNLDLVFDGDATACLIFGFAPAGVALSHRAIVRLVTSEWHGQATRDDRMAFVGEPVFEEGALEAWALLLRGGCILLSDAKVRSDSERWSDNLRGQRANALHLNAAGLDRRREPLRAAFPWLSSLLADQQSTRGRVGRYVVRSSPSDQLAASTPAPETTLFVTSYDFWRVSDGAAALHLGRPMHRTHVYALGEDGRPESIGTMGDLADQESAADTGASSPRSDAQAASSFDLLDPSGQDAWSTDARANANERYEAPQGPVETTLARLWQELLAVEKVGRTDNFFELGGHSLLAVTLLDRMRREGLFVEATALFAAPTLTALASEVDSKNNAFEVPPNGIPEGCVVITPAMLPLVQLSEEAIEKVVSSVPGGAPNVQDIYPLTPLQEGILFHHLLEDRSDPYLMYSGMQFDSRERLDRYMDVVRAVMKRHDILRTAFRWEGLLEPVQVVWRNAPLAIEEVQLDPGAGEADEQLRARLDRVRYRIDIRQAPLMRIWIAYDAGRARWIVLNLIHHLIGDAATWGMMLREIEAHLLGQANKLARSKPFRDFVAQARQAVSQEEHEAFFRRMLGDVTECTAPFGWTSAHWDGRGVGEGRRKVDPGLTKRLRERAQRLGVSVASVFHLAWAMVLARTSARDDVVFGSVLLGRLQGSHGVDIFGVALNTLPVRIRVGDSGAEDSLLRTHKLLSQLLRHEQASLALAQRCSSVPSPSPLFTALLNYVRVEQRVILEPGAWEGIEFGATRELTSYPLSLVVEDQGDEGFLLFVQVLEPVDPLQICDMMHAALEGLAGALEKSPQAAIGKLDTIPANEQHRLLVEWNQTSAPFPREQCIHRLFEARAAKYPAQVAVVCGSEVIDYGELNKRANRLAHHLRELGAAPGVLVATLLPRSIELVVAELAILKCGAAYVPLDENAPAQRHASVLDECRARLVVTGHSSTLAQGAGATEVRIDQLERGGPEHDDEAVLSSETIAYVMHTSGSTGRPKGVAVPHRAMASLLFSGGHAKFEVGDRVAFVANPAFDASIVEVWAPLLHGGCIVVIDRETLLSPARLKETLQAHRVNVLALTAGLFQQYAPLLGEAFEQQDYLIVGGDVVDLRSVRQVLENNPPGHFIHAYGPTETTLFALTHQVTELSPDTKRIPIGRPISNTSAYILDQHDRPVPAGVVGELCIGGAGMALGYWNQPELTAERFVPDLFCGHAGARMYRTGDLARHSADGRVEFVGRNDMQVKVRGYRIEIAEVEEHLRSHPAIGDVVVVVREDAPGDKRLVAYYTSGESPAQTRVDVERSENADTTGLSESDSAAAVGGSEADELRRYLGEKLPDYMVPAAYVRLSSLPLTEYGKVNRNGMPVPEEGTVGEGDFEAPIGDVETTLARIWSEILDVERVARQDNFFSLGGHSLLVIELMEAMRREGLQTDVHAVFAARTLMALAAVTEALEEVIV